MHDGMPYDPIQGQGHETLPVGNSAIKFDRVGFLIFGLVFVSRKVEKPVRRSRPSAPHRANFYNYYHHL